MLIAKFAFDKEFFDPRLYTPHFKNFLFLMILIIISQIEESDKGLKIISLNKKNIFFCLKDEIIQSYKVFFFV